MVREGRVDPSVRGSASGSGRGEGTEKDKKGSLAGASRHFYFLLFCTDPEPTEVHDWT